MAVRNVGGHGVSSMAGHHNQQAMAANIQFPGGGGMTDSQRHASDGMTAYSGSAKGADVGAYGRPAGSKKSSAFPPAK